MGIGEGGVLGEVGYGEGVARKETHDEEDGKDLRRRREELGAGGYSVTGACAFIIWLSRGAFTCLIIPPQILAIN